MLRVVARHYERIVKGPAAVGEKVIVTGSLVFGASVNGPPPLSVNGAPIAGSPTLPCNGPLSLLRTLIVLVAFALGFASKWTLSGFTTGFQRPAVGVAVAVGVGVGVGVIVGVAVA